MINTPEGRLTRLKVVSDRIIVFQRLKKRTYPQAVELQKLQKERKEIQRKHPLHLV